jgi:hypothetical protein
MPWVHVDPSVAEGFEGGTGGKLLAGDGATCPRMSDAKYWKHVRYPPGVGYEPVAAFVTTPSDR